jgi:hypothetical protein
MKIATLNIDWCKKIKSDKVEAFLNQQDFDFLILTEAINLNLSNFPFKYFSEQIPENIEYEGLNYSEYLNGEKAYRTIIYSKIPSKRKFSIIDDKTSLALEFETEFGDLVIYATIIGTQFKRKPFAKNELENCISDCERISEINPNLFIIGDLNTSFLETEKYYSINSETTEGLKSLFETHNLVNSTEKIEKNIDHIVIPKFLVEKITDANIFVAKDFLSDHQGVFISLD